METDWVQFFFVHPNLSIKITYYKRHKQIWKHLLLNEHQYNYSILSSIARNIHAY